MSFATIFLGTSFVLEILLTLYYLWTANELPENNNETTEGKKKTLTLMFSGWQKSLGLFAIMFLLFFIYYGSLLVILTDTTTIYDSAGAIKNTIKTEDWRLGYQFLQIMIGLMAINIGILAWRILRQTELLFLVFGNKTRKWDSL